MDEHEHKKITNASRLRVVLAGRNGIHVIFQAIIIGAHCFAPLIRTMGGNQATAIVGCYFVMSGYQNGLTLVDSVLLRHFPRTAKSILPLIRKDLICYFCRRWIPLILVIEAAHIVSLLSPASGPSDYAAIIPYEEPVTSMWFNRFYASKIYGTRQNLPLWFVSTLILLYLFGVVYIVMAALIVNYLSPARDVFANERYVRWWKLCAWIHLKKPLGNTCQLAEAASLVPASRRKEFEALNKVGETPGHKDLEIGNQDIERKDQRQIANEITEEAPSASKTTAPMFALIDERNYGSAIFCSAVLLAVTVIGDLYWFQWTIAHRESAGGAYVSVERRAFQYFIGLFGAQVVSLAFRAQEMTRWSNRALSVIIDIGLLVALLMSVEALRDPYVNYLFFRQFADVPFLVGLVHLTAFRRNSFFGWILSGRIFNRVAGRNQAVPLWCYALHKPLVNILERRVVFHDDFKKPVGACVLLLVVAANCDFYVQTAFGGVATAAQRVLVKRFCAAVQPQN